MGYVQIETPPVCEPVALGDMKTYLKVAYAAEDTMIQTLIVAARELVEGFTSRSMINKGYVQVLDSFPYFVDSVMSQMAYPPSYYSLPRFSTTLWNYSQMIKLLISPLQKVGSLRIIYLGTDAQYHTLNPSAIPWRPNTFYSKGTTVLDGNGNLEIAQQDGTTDLQPPNTASTGVSGSQGSAVSWATSAGGITVEATLMTWKNGGPATFNQLAPGGVSSNTFFADATNEPPRLFPGPAGSFWPPVMYVPNAVEIHFTAGMADGQAVGSPVSFIPPTELASVTMSQTGVWSKMLAAIYMLVAGWYENRESITPLSLKEMPWGVEQLLWNARVLDNQPTRG